MFPVSATTYQARSTLFAFAVMMIAWSLVWMLKSYLDENQVWLKSEFATAIYWLVAKLALWIVPAFLLIEMSGRNFASVINLSEWRRWLFWGTMFGLLIAITGMVPKMFACSPLLPKKIDYDTMNVLIVAPLFEEFLIRAAILGNLIPALGFARANVVAAICFVVLHLPGWYMMGSLVEKFSQPIGGALSLFVIGLCFGWATQRGRSFLGGSIAHFFNNFTS